MVTFDCFCQQRGDSASSQAQENNVESIPMAEIDLTVPLHVPGTIPAHNSK